MEKINVKQIKDFELNGEEKSLTEHLEGIEQTIQDLNVDELKQRLNEFGEGDILADENSIEREFAELQRIVDGNELNSDGYEEDYHIGDVNDPYELWFNDYDTSIGLIIKNHETGELIVKQYFDPRRYVGTSRKLTVSGGFEYYTDENETAHGYLYRTTAEDISYDVFWRSWAFLGSDLTQNLYYIGSGDTLARYDSLSRQLAIINNILNGNQPNCDCEEIGIKIGDINNPYTFGVGSDTNYLGIKIYDRETGSYLTWGQWFDPQQYIYPNKLSIGYNINNKFEYYTDANDHSTGYLYRTTAPDHRYDMIIAGFISYPASLSEQAKQLRERLDNISEGDATAHWDTLERQFFRLWSFMWGNEPDCDTDDTVQIGDSTNPYNLWFSEENSYIDLSIYIHENQQRIVSIGFNPRQYMGSNHPLTIGSGNFQFQYYTNPDECWHGYLYRTTARNTDYDLVWQSYTNHHGNLQDQIENIRDYIGEGDLGSHYDSLDKQLALIHYALDGYERNCDTDDDTHIGDINDWYDMWLDPETDWLSIKIIDYLTEQVYVNRVFNPWQYEGYSRRLTLGYGNNQFEFYMEEDDGHNHGYLYRTTAPDNRYLLIADGFKNHGGSLQDQLDNITPNVEELVDRLNSFDNGEILGEEDTLENNFAELWYQVLGNESIEDYYNYGEEVVIGNSEDPYEIHFGEETNYVELRVGPTSSWPINWTQVGFNPTLYTDGSELGIGNNLKYYTDEGRPGYGWLYRYTGDEISYTVKWKTFVRHNATLQEQINELNNQVIPINNYFDYDVIDYKTNPSKSTAASNTWKPSAFSRENDGHVCNLGIVTIKFNNVETFSNVPINFDTQSDSYWDSENEYWEFASGSNVVRLRLNSQNDNYIDYNVVSGASASITVNAALIEKRAISNKDLINLYISTL